MKAFVGGILHETNTQSPLPTDLQSFREFDLVLGKDVRSFDDLGITRIFKIEYAALTLDVELARGLSAFAQPSAPLSNANYCWLRDQLLADLRDALPVDFILLPLHGAMIAEGVDDVEGDILQSVREIIGDEIPLGAVLDLHGNVSARMVETGATLFGVKEYPHTDFAERTFELMSVLQRQVRKEVKPVTAMQRVPMLGLFPTTSDPMRKLLANVSSIEQQPGVLNVTLMHGFPWGDVQDAGACVLVTTDNDRDSAAMLASNIGQEFFRAYPDIEMPRMDVEAAVRNASKVTGRPNIIADAADNPGGGSACDSTFLLRAMLDSDFRPIAFGMLWDPGAVDICFRAGVGADIALRVGGKMGPTSGAPVDLRGRVLAVNEGLMQVSSVLDYPMGRTATLLSDGLFLVLTDFRNQTFGPNCFTENSVPIEEMKMVGLKSSQHFYEMFEDLAGEILYADSGASMSRDYASLGLKNIVRPMYPLDKPPFNVYGHNWSMT